MIGLSRNRQIFAAPSAWAQCAWSLRAEALPIFAGDDEGLHHLGVDEVAVELVELVEPEVVTVEV